MKVIVLGASGMIGQGVLRECLADTAVESVLALGREGLRQVHEKLREVVQSDLMNLAPVEAELSGYDACFFCLGVSAIGMSEAKYTTITFDLTIETAKVLARLNPDMTFIYVSGRSTDSTEKGRQMWARVKGKTENALMRLPFKAVYLFRPGVVQPLDGIVSRTRAYRIAYAILKPVMPLVTRQFPDSITTTRLIGIAMLEVARRGFPKHVLENKDINSIGQLRPLRS